MALTYVFKISKPGFSAQDDVNKQNFIFRSDLVSMAQKSVLHPTVTTVSVSTNDGSEGQGNAIIHHNFGYYPKFLAFVTDSLGDYHQVPGGLTTLAASDKGDELFESFKAEVDENFLYLDVRAFTYNLIPQVSFDTTAKLYTYTFDIVLFMERVGLGLVSNTKVKFMTAKGYIA